MAQAAPGCCADRHPPSSRCVAKLWRKACGETVPPARSATTPARAVHMRRRRLTSLVPSGRPALRGTAHRPRRPGRRARAAPPPAQPRARSRYSRTAAIAGSPTGHEARLSPLALDAQLLAVVVHVDRLQRHQLLRAQAARVGQLEHRPVAQLQWAARRDRVEQARRFRRAEHPRQVRAPSRRRDQVRRVLGDQRRARAGSRTARVAPPACVRSCSVPRPARRGARCSGAPPLGRALAGPSLVRPPTARTAPRRRR